MGALEQTINAEAKHRLKGFMAYADISSAVNRWLVTSSLRSQIVNGLLEIADIQPPNEGNKELREKKIKKDTSDLGLIKNVIGQTINPFDHDSKESLYNLQTGQSISSQGEAFLLNIFENGNALKEKKRKE